MQPEPPFLAAAQPPNLPEVYAHCRVVGGASETHLLTVPHSRELPSANLSHAFLLTPASWLAVSQALRVRFLDPKASHASEVVMSQALRVTAPNPRQGPGVSRGAVTASSREKCQVKLWPKGKNVPLESCGSQIKSAQRLLPNIERCSGGPRQIRSLPDHPQGFKKPGICRVLPW